MPQPTMHQFLVSETTSVPLSVSPAPQPGAQILAKQQVFAALFQTGLKASASQVLPVSLGPILPLVLTEDFKLAGLAATELETNAPQANSIKQVSGLQSTWEQLIRHQLEKPGGDLQVSTPLESEWVAISVFSWNPPSAPAVAVHFASVAVPALPELSLALPPSSLLASPQTLLPMPPGLLTSHHPAESIQSLLLVSVQVDLPVQAEPVQQPVVSVPTEQTAITAESISLHQPLAALPQNFVQVSQQTPWPHSIRAAAAEISDFLPDIFSPESLDVSSSWALSAQASDSQSEQTFSKTAAQHVPVALVSPNMARTQATHIADRQVNPEFRPDPAISEPSTTGLEVFTDLSMTPVVSAEIPPPAPPPLPLLAQTEPVASLQSEQLIPAAEEEAKSEPSVPVHQSAEARTSSTQATQVKITSVPGLARPESASLTQKPAPGMQPMTGESQATLGLSVQSEGLQGAPKQSLPAAFQPLPQAPLQELNLPLARPVLAAETAEAQRLSHQPLLGYHPNGSAIEADVFRELTTPTPLQAKSLAERFQLVQQLSQQLRYISRALGGNQTKTQHELRLSLEPGALGKVTLHLQQQATQWQLHIFADLALTRELIESQLQQLRQQFVSLGLDLQEITVDVHPDSSREQHRMAQEQAERELAQNTQPFSLSDPASEAEPQPVAVNTSEKIINYLV